MDIKIKTQLSTFFYFLDSSDIDNDVQFQQLAIFFGELIGNNIFSHNQYLCTLIARNDLSPEILEKMDSILNFKTETSDRSSKVNSCFVFSILLNKYCIGFHLFQFF